MYPSNPTSFGEEFLGRGALIQEPRLSFALTRHEIGCTSCVEGAHSNAPLSPSLINTFPPPITTLQISQSQQWFHQRASQRIPSFVKRRKKVCTLLRCAPGLFGVRKVEDITLTRNHNRCQTDAKQRWRWKRPNGCMEGKLHLSTDVHLQSSFLILS